MRVFITRKIPQTAVEQLENAGITITQWSEKRNLTPEELIENCLRHDALLSSGPNKINRTFLEACSHLKVIALLSAGFDQVDVQAATELGIPVGNTPDVLSRTTADIAFLLLLAASRKAFFMHRKMLEGKEEFFEPQANLGIELYGKTLGIFGLGKIGIEFAKKCAAMFDMKIIYHNRSRNEEAETQLGASMVSFEKLLQQSDVVSVHAALTNETKGVFNKDAFAQMKPDAIFINAARGGIHNETDLTEALQNKTIWGAGLDVTNPEPMDPESRLLRMENVAVLPHIGSSTVETRNAMAKRAADNIISGLKGEKIPYPVNPEIYK